jgi:hypothetical protein
MWPFKKPRIVYGERLVTLSKRAASIPASEICKWIKAQRQGEDIAVKAPDGKQYRMVPIDGTAAMLGLWE